MPKLSQKLRDERRARLIKKYAERRAELRRKLKDQSIAPGEKLDLQTEFAKLPRNSCPTRLTRRCRLTGRARAVYRKFGISRIAMRELGLRGELPGLRKSSW
ncbi:MAG: 30S ribosomal protein S14 [Myxococcota bacterium]